jgi:hypothetical protein
MGGRAASGIPTPSSEDFAASRAKDANLPGIAAFFATIDALASAEEGVLTDGE